MKASGELFQLIKSLNKSEKRYFKLNFPGRESTNYLMLFDAMDKQESYNEQSIKEKFKNEKFIKQLTFTKNYLYNSIFNSLISFNRAASSETQLTEIVIKLRILFNKNLYPQYFKALKNFKQKAWEYEKFYILIEILRLQRLISEARKFRTFNQQVIYDEEKAVLEKISNLGEYSRLFNYSQSLKRKAGIAGKKQSIREADKILEEKLLSDVKYALSTQAIEYYYHIKEVLYSIKGDTVKQYGTCKKRLECIESNPKPFLDDIVDVRKESLYTLTGLAIEIGKGKEFKYYLGKYFLSKEINISGKDAISNHINLKYILHTKNLKNGNAICNRVEEDLVKYKGKLNKDMELENMFMITKYYFYLKDYKMALNKNNDVLTHPLIKYRKDLYIYAKLFNLSIHYELGNMGLIEYLIEAVKKLLKNDSALYEEEIEAVAVIQKMTEFHYRKDKLVLNDLMVKLKRMKAVFSMRESSYYLDLPFWIEEKLISLSGNPGTFARKDL
jgi:hypothetical protein